MNKCPYCGGIGCKLCPPKIKRKKYNNTLTTVDGIEFHSEAEAKYYQVLKTLRGESRIFDFQLQPKFTLLEAGETDYGEKYAAITYTADFAVLHNDGSEEVIDVKGFEPRDFPLRKKLFHAMYPHVKLSIIGELPIKYGGPGFVPLADLKKLRAAEKRAKRQQVKAGKEQVKQTKKQAAAIKKAIKKATK